jgi:hypothetical protein
MHIAALIYFLSFARFQDYLPTPANYLNSVLIDFEKKQAPNMPILVKNVRKDF